MYRSYDYSSGYAPRLYREPSEIRRDIRDIAEKIEDVNYMLNVRYIISEVISEHSENENNAARGAAAVAEIVEYAREALDKMRELEEALDELKDELSRTLEAV